MGLFLIAAIARDGALGVTRDEKPGLPWAKLIHDQAWFRSITQSVEPLTLARQWCHDSVPVVRRVGSQNAVVMGRRTRESLGFSLGWRINIVVTADIPNILKDNGTDYKVKNLETALRYGVDLGQHTFVIGGTRLFAEALLRPELAALFLTEISSVFPSADTWFPHLGPLNDRLPENCGWQDDGLLYTAQQGHYFRRYVVSPWIEEPDAPRYRFGIWRRAC